MPCCVAGSRPGPAGRSGSERSRSTSSSGARVAAGAPVELTTTEFDLLAHLMRRPGRVFPREELLADVWGYPAGTATRTVDVHVAQLRAKLGQRLTVRSVRGVGYAVEP